MLALLYTLGGMTLKPHMHNPSAHNNLKVSALHINKPTEEQINPPKKEKKNLPKLKSIATPI
jgi:hypothetical protein